MRRFIAVDCAALTKPSSSAPLKFLVKVASSCMDKRKWMMFKFSSYDSDKEIMTVDSSR